MTLVDFYGFGLTPHPDTPLTVDDYALSVVNLIRYYKMENVTLVCHSFGGRVGIKIAAKYGYLLNKLILVDSAGIKPRRGAIYYAKIFRHKILTKLKIPHEAGSDDYKKMSGTMRETFKNVVNEDLSGLLARITVPALIIWGNKDEDTPIYMARKLKKRLANSELIVFEGCGHFAYVERHGLFCKIVKCFLAEDSDGVDCNGSFGNRGRGRTIKIPMPKSK